MATAPDPDKFYRDLLESVVQKAPDLIYFKNPAHELVYSGDMYAEILNKDPVSVVGKTAWDLWPEEKAQLIIEDETRALNGNPIVGRERKVTHADGTEHWYSINKHPRYDDNQNVVGFFAIDRDITDRKEYELELERYQAFVQHSGDVITLVNEQGVIEYVSPAAEDSLGQSQSALVGNSPLDFVHPDDLEPVEAALTQLIAEPYDIGTLEFRFRGADGGWTWVETTGVHRPDVDGIGGILLVARDISKRKARERQSNRLKQAVDASGHAIYMTAPDGTIQYVNPAFESMTGFSADEAVGQTPRIMNSGAMDPDHYDALWGTIKQGKVWDEEIINQRKSGEQYTAQQTIAPIEKNGQISAFVAIQTDITDRIELEERLSVVNRILRHDIRSAVSVIRGNAELALDSDRNLPGLLENIQSEANRLHRLGENARYIESVLSQGETKTTVVDLADIVPANALHLRDEYPDATINFDVPDSAPVSASSRLEEAITELCTNAIVHNVGDHAQVTITVEYPPDQPWGILEVADNGPGIPADEIYPLEHGIESSLEHSSGLGLWVAQWIVQESGGTLEFETDESAGTRVRIKLQKSEAGA